MKDAFRKNEREKMLLVANVQKKQIQSVFQSPLIKMGLRISSYDQQYFLLPSKDVF